MRFETSDRFWSSLARSAQAWPLWRSKEVLTKKGNFVSIAGDSAHALEGSDWRRDDHEKAGVPETPTVYARTEWDRALN